MNRSKAEIVREYGPFPGADQVGGVTYDGHSVWFAAGGTLHTFEDWFTKPPPKEFQGSS